MYVCINIYIYIYTHIHTQFYGDENMEEPFHGYIWVIFFSSRNSTPRPDMMVNVVVTLNPKFSPYFRFENSYTLPGFMVDIWSING